MVDERKEQVTEKSIGIDDIVKMVSDHHTLKCIRGELAKVLAVANSSDDREPISGMRWELLVELEKSKEHIYVGFNDVEVA